jgi:hypothetical protein
VVHVALAVLGVERVDHLLHAGHVQRGDTQDLGLAALEQRGAVHAGQHLDLGAQLADVLEATAVDAAPCP